MQRLARHLRFVLLILLCACGSNDTGKISPDGTPPGRVEDLHASALGPQVARLLWTAPGDDGFEGRAAKYEVRRSTTAFSDSTFDAASLLAVSLKPSTAGSVDSLTVEHLTPGGTYYFALRASDDAGNVSGMSNVAAVALPPADTAAPRAVADLTPHVLSPSTILLVWTAPGDDGDTGTAAGYAIRMLNRLSSTLFAVGTPVPDVPAPLVAGTSQAVKVRNLQPATDYYFVMRTVDESGNWSGDSNITLGRTPALPDTIPPGAVGDLSVVRSGATTARLEWTAPGNDGNTGTALSYDLRHASSPISAGDWDAAKPVDDPPKPSSAGTVETFLVTGLPPGATVYFAVRSMDDSENISEVSNAAVVTLHNPRVWNVNTEGSGDTPTIQGALDLAVNGDEIRVEAGVYRENLHFRGQDVRLLAVDGPEQTILDGGAIARPVVVMDQAEGPEAGIDGFTIRGGRATYSEMLDWRDGGGILLRDASPVISNCRVTGNAGRWGGGIALENRDVRHPGDPRPLIQFCEVDNNKSYAGGGGIYLGAGYPEITGCNVHDNLGGSSGEADGGGVFTYGASFRAEDCIFRDNTATDHGGGLAIWTPRGSPEVIMRRCLIAHNRALRTPVNAQAGSGSGIHMVSHRGEISNCTIAFNGGELRPGCDGGGVSIESPGTGFRFVRNIIAGNVDCGLACWGTTPAGTFQDNILWNNATQNIVFASRCDTTDLAGQIFADPLFCDPDNGDFRVSPDSPAVRGPLTIGAYRTPGCSGPPPKTGIRR